MRRDLPDKYLLKKISCINIRQNRLRGKSIIGDTF